jgi:hypothetical protein
VRAIQHDRWSLHAASRRPWSPRRHTVYEPVRVSVTYFFPIKPQRGIHPQTSCGRDPTFRGRPARIIKASQGDYMYQVVHLADAEIISAILPILLDLIHSCPGLTVDLSERIDIFADGMRA